MSLQFRKCATIYTYPQFSHSPPPSLRRHPALSCSVTMSDSRPPPTNPMHLCLPESGDTFAFVDNVMSLDRADFSVGRPVDVMFPQRENGTVRSVNFQLPRPGQAYPDRCVSIRIYQRNTVIVSSVHISLYYPWFLGEVSIKIHVHCLLSQDSSDIFCWIRICPDTPVRFGAIGN